MSTIKLSQQEARRLIGGQMLLDGYDAAEAAQALKASRTTVYPWQAVVESEGLDGLKRQGQSGRTSLCR